MKIVNRLMTIVGAGAVALSLMVGASQVARAEETSCSGTLGAVTVDNLRVPQNATCTLNRTVVQGTIIVETGATLRASGVKVNGNVQAEGAARVNLTAGSTVGGSVQLKQGKAARIDRISVKGDIQVFQNSGAISITNNRVDGNLQCKANTPAPTGSGNVVQGVKEDQCAGF